MGSMLPYIAYMDPMGIWKCPISMWMHRMFLHWLEHLGTAWNSFTVKPAQWLRFQIFQSSALPKFGIKNRWNPTDDLCKLFFVKHIGITLPFIHSQVFLKRLQVLPQAFRCCMANWQSPECCRTAGSRRPWEFESSAQRAHHFHSVGRFIAMWVK